MKKIYPLSLITAALLSSLNAAELILEPIAITTTAIATDELRSTDSIEVYTAKDIQNSQARDLYEFFNTQTSLIAMPSYGNPFAQKLDMRGFGIGDGYQNIVITINGRRLNNIDMMPQLLSSISPESVERIEIIKSSGIVIGGDGANAGVINITTKKSDAKKISFYGGAYGVFGSSLYLGHIDEKLTLNGAFDTQRFGGIREIDSDGNNDTNQIANGNATLAYKANDAIELRLGVLFSKIDVIYGGTMTQDEFNTRPSQQGTGPWGPSNSSHQKLDSNVLSTGMSYYLSQKITFNLDANHEKKKSENLSFDMESDYIYNSAKASLDLRDDYFSLSTGVDLFDGTRDSYENLFALANSTDKKNIAAFIMSQYSYQKHSFKAGARQEKVKYKFSDLNNNLQEKHSLFGAELGYNYTINNQNSFFTNYSQSYQAPDVDRFFNRNWSGTVSFNGFINPMKANNYTLGYNNITQSNKLKISIYYIDLKDEIYYYPGINWVGDKNTNIDKSHKYGFDIYDKYIISDSFNVMLNYNYVQAIIDKEIENGEDYSGNKLPGVSNHNAKTTLAYLPNQKTTFALTQILRSKAHAMNDFSNTMTQRQKAFNSTDISFKYSEDNYELFVKINNLLNQKNGLWISDNAIYPVNFTTTGIAGLTLKY